MATTGVCVSPTCGFVFGIGCLGVFTSGCVFGGGNRVGICPEVTGTVSVMGFWICFGTGVEIGGKRVGEPKMVG